MTETGQTAQTPAAADSIGRLAELINGDPTTRMDADMHHVLDQLAALGARPLELTTPDLARRQPRPAQAIEAILNRQNREQPGDGIASGDIEIDGAEGKLAARLYHPPGLLSRLNPMVLYFHGGGFVTGDLDSHDASARALSRRTGSIVVSVAYRLAPEHKFPAAHDDALAAWAWLRRNAAELTGDPRRMVVAGEDAGANLAAHVALANRDGGAGRPIHQLLINPIAGTDMTTPSYGETLRAKPIGLPAMRWRFRHLLDNDEQKSDPRLVLAERQDLTGAAPTTILLAGIDPLRSEGEALAEALSAAGVRVNCLTYEGVTQGFFGLGAVVTKALFAQADAAEALNDAFAPSRRS